jgi:hypothetical protein
VFTESAFPPHAHLRNTSIVAADVLAPFPFFGVKRFHKLIILWYWQKLLCWNLLKIFGLLWMKEDNTQVIAKVRGSSSYE